MTVTVREVLVPALSRLVPARAVPSIVSTAYDTGAAVGTLDLIALSELMAQIATGIRLFGGTVNPKDLRELRQLLADGRAAPPRVVHLVVASDADILTVQSQCQRLCRNLFSGTDCVRIATAASELARNIYLYAKRGTVTLTVSEDAQASCFEIRARDDGPGIADVALVLSGHYTSRTGLGRGLVGTQQLLDGLEIDSGPGRGTTVRGWKKARR